MRTFLVALNYFLRAIAVGISYCGAIGLAFGALIGQSVGGELAFAVWGALIGLKFGMLGGVIFGLLGGIIGGPAGWAFAGFVGGVVGCTLEQPTISIDLFNLLPAILLTVVGIFIGHSQAHGSPTLPLTSWLHRLWNQARPLHQVTKLRVSLALFSFTTGIIYIAMKVTIHH